ncbi:hypothetical protein E2C01_012867 [Portunus trituberculatus]|uniref:Secreted protein n=1 Tax=Portunus trituberculatus TaxID=210409 RepID=A0A5B7DFK9_PORTR|nr:hypothetical protein [Portunus trituberculatus]
MNDGPLLVIDLLLLLVAQQQHHGTEQEDGSTPANAVSPPELPQDPHQIQNHTPPHPITPPGPLGRPQQVLTSKSHHPDGNPVVTCFDRRVVVAQTEACHDGGKEVQQQTDDTQGSAGHDVGWGQESSFSSSSSSSSSRICVRWGQISVRLLHILWEKKKKEEKVPNSPPATVLCAVSVYCVIGGGEDAEVKEQILTFLIRFYE